MPIGCLTYGGPGGSEDYSSIAPGINIMYHGIYQSNLALKADFTACAPKSDEFDGWDCTELIFDFGACYAFINWDSFSIAALGMIGCSLNSYTAGIGSLWAVTFDVGGDIIAAYNFFNFIGVYASFGVRCKIPIYGEFDLGSSTLSDDIYIRGLEFTPTIGIMIHF